MNAKGVNNGQAQLYILRNNETTLSWTKMPIFGQQYLKSGIFNHFVVCCRSKPYTKQKETKKTTRRWSREQQNQTQTQAANLRVNTFIKRLTKVTPNVSEDSQDTVLMRMKDVDGHVEPDSGASADVMDRYQSKHRSKKSQN